MIKDDLKADVEAGDITKLEIESKCGKEEAEELGSASGTKIPTWATTKKEKSFKSSKSTAASGIKSGMQSLELMRRVIQ